MPFQEFSKMSSSVSGCNSLDTLIQVCLSFTDPPPKKSRAFFPRGPCFPWRPATAKIPPLTYKDIILYTHRGTESLLSCSWCSPVWVSLLSAALLLSRFLLKPSDLLLLRDKGDTQETREAVPSGAGGEAGKGWEERDLLLWHLLITSSH